MLTECVNCGFYVGSDAKFCPDCGVSAPGEPLKFSADDFDRPLMFKLAAAVVILIFGSIVFFRQREGNHDFSDLLFLLPLIVLFSLIPAIFASLFVLSYRRKAERGRFAAAENEATNFRFLQDTILLRNHELRLRLDAFPATTKRGVRLSVNYEKSNRAAAEKNEILNLIARYDLLSAEIEFARLENKLPMLAARRKDSKNGDEDFLEKLDQIRSELESINLSLTDDAAAVPEDFQIEKRDFLARIEAAEKFCRELSEPTSGDIQPLDSIRRTDRFAVQQMLGDFIRSLNESEREYQRLKIQIDGGFQR